MCDFEQSEKGKKFKMEKIIVLGTGSGTTINCYSLSALLENNQGNLILQVMKQRQQILNLLNVPSMDLKQF